ncbi:hypothetical protein QAD02_011928 [Eretmocerus hayati]|uniref:Uncharacterized protein n=1 Tax=Eretmocerus hayati TaxID=131215 RepID=A0ACC2NYD9_9HYME|nr:hypothetical protein QAD02_011928 [Eretmocerus hayati]
MENENIPDRRLGIVEMSPAEIRDQYGSSNQNPYPRNRRAINGSMVNDHDYRYIVSLHKPGTDAFSCAGTILTPKLILTAAHCIKNKTSRPTHIRVSNVNGLHKTIVKIEDYILHESFNATGLINDIGLLLLRDPIPNSKCVQRAPKNSTLESGTTVVAYGWGKTAENGTISKNLISVELPISDRPNCFITHDKSRICVETNKGASLCEGDSGGPLMWKNYQIGIISANVVSCTSGRPSRSTSVPAFVEWIDEKIRLYDKVNGTISHYCMT